MAYPVAFLDFCATVAHKPTSLRKNVLYILWRSDKPLKAYDILEQLLQFNANAKPPAVYRVLDYFVALGLVHKIESIQSYSLCQEHEKNTIVSYSWYAITAMRWLRCMIRICMP